MKVINILKMINLPLLATEKTENISYQYGFAYLTCNIIINDSGIKD